MVPAGWDGWRMEGATSSKQARTEYASPEKWSTAHRMTFLRSEQADFPSGEHATPLVLGEAIIVGSSAREVLAMTWDTEELIWKTPTKGRVLSAPAYEDGRVFVADDEGVLLALDLDGKELWRHVSTYPLLVSPVVDGGNVYVVNANQELICLDTESGDPRWSYASPVSSEGSIWRGTSIAIGGANLYMGLADGRVVALDARVGSVQWKTRLGENTEFPDVTVGPVFDEGTVYAGSRQGLYALNAKAGNIQWSKPYAAVGGLAAGSSNLYFGTGDGGFACVDKKDGVLLWTTALEGGISTAPVLAGGEVIMGSSRGAIMALDASNGKVIKSSRPGSGLSARPWVGEKGLAFISNAGVLHRFTR
jgi:outer membrane protein assembly factor BamB